MSNTIIKEGVKDNSELVRNYKESERQRAAKEKGSSENEIGRRYNMWGRVCKRLRGGR